MITTDLRTILFLGLPGSGKGTQAKLLADRLGWPLFSSGNKFKQLIAEDGVLGKRIAEDYRHGVLSPDWFAAYFFEDAIVHLDEKEGIIAEGFPRSLPQAELADTIFGWLGRPYRVFHLKVDEAEAERRQLERAKLEKRPDSDDEEKIKNRFRVYHERTEPMIEFFKERGALVEIDGTRTPDEIAADIYTQLTSG